MTRLGSTLLIALCLLWPATSEAGLWVPVRMLPMQLLAYTVHVDMSGSGLDATQQASVLASMSADYSFMADSITFTNDPNGATDTVVTVVLTSQGNPGYFGRAYTTYASVFVSEFSVETEFSDPNSLLNAVADSASHELDHILRGGGHSSSDPSDLNCSGECAPWDERATLERTFNQTDMDLKTSHVNDGTAGTLLDHKDGQVSFLWGYDFTAQPPQTKPEDHQIAFQLINVVMPSPNMTFGVLNDANQFISYVFPGEVEGSGSASPAAQVNFAVENDFGDIFDAATFGSVNPGGPLVPASFSVDPVVSDPYFQMANIQINTDMGPVSATLVTPDLTGFVMGPLAPAVPLLGGWATVLLVGVLVVSVILLMRQQRSPRPA